MARPRQFNDADVLKTMLDVFWAGGFEGTSLANIVDATGLQKASLYGAFGDKRAMYLKALAAYDDTYVKGAIAMMSARPGREAILSFLHLPADAVRANDLRGCFLCSALQEVQRIAPEAARLAERSRADFVEGILDALQRGWPEKDWESCDAEEWLALYFGLRVLARSGTSAERLSALANSAFARLQVSSTPPG